jgi:hypothetical protein
LEEGPEFREFRGYSFPWKGGNNMGPFCGAGVFRSRRAYPGPVPIRELAEKLGISKDAVYFRLRTAGIEPLTRQAIYPQLALEAIREGL